MWQCSQQHENREEAKFCAKCGERRVTSVPCAACGAMLEPEDMFCTSCGSPRKSESKPAAPAPTIIPVAPVAPVEPPPIAKPTPPVPPPPIPQAVAPAPAQEVILEAPAPEAPKEDEPVTFSFGGTMVSMKEPGKADKPKVARKRGGMNPTTSAILSFVLVALVLWGALYLITR